MIVKLQLSRSTFSTFALLSSEVTGPIFTKISHDVEASVLLLIRAFTKRCCIFCFEMPQQRVKINFDVCKKAPKLIGYHSNDFNYRKNYFNFIIGIHEPTNAEKFDPVLAEIFGMIFRFLALHSKRYRNSLRNLWG